jgi:hypothetical protein
MKAIVIIFILLIIGSRASALFFLVKDKGRGASSRTVRALTWRVVFSIVLFAMLMLGFHFGFLPNKV